MTCSIETAPKKTKSYLYLIHIKPSKKNLPLPLLLYPAHVLYIHTLFLIKRFSSPQKAEIHSRTSGVTAKSIATFCMTVLLQPSLAAFH